MPSESSERTSDRAARRVWLVEAAALGAGVGLLCAALAADRAWFDRHVFVPYYYLVPPRLAPALRLAAALAGLGLCASARRLGRGAGAVRARLDAGGLLAAAFALAGALVVAEGLLRVVGAAPLGQAYGGYELKIGRQDPYFGWVAVPSRTTTLSADGRPYAYAVNALGLRARAQGDALTFDRPALVVDGESIASGYGLSWDDTFAAECGRRLGLEPVILAEGGYGVDQAYLRLAETLPRLPRVAALVTVFVPAQLGRSLRDDRPRLVLDGAGDLRWAPAAEGFFARTRLRGLFVNRLPYASDAALANALALARVTLEATAGQARARGARPLFVVPSLGASRPLDAHPEAPIIRSLFVDTGLPYVLVDLGPDEIFAADGHPNAAGARRIAAAITSALGGP